MWPSSPRSGFSGGATTSFPPLSSAPQISSVDASNDTGARCSSTSFAPSSTKSVCFTSRSTARCGTAVPLGTPVEPDVYITYARCSGPRPSTETAPSLCASMTAASPSSETTCRKLSAVAGSFSSSASCATSTPMAESSSMKPSRSAG